MAKRSGIFVHPLFVLSLTSLFPVFGNNEYGTSPVQEQYATIRYALNEKLNTLPSPGVLVTRMAPPWASMNSREMARPRPVPPLDWLPGTLK